MTMPAFIFEDPQFVHVPVLLGEVLAALEPGRGGTFVDATLGGAGHAHAVLAASLSVRLLGFDRDPDAVMAASSRLLEFRARSQVVHSSFAGIKSWLEQEGIPKVDGLLADLGVSSHQLGEAERGMSFRVKGPLDMRMDTTQGETALELIERVSQEELADIVYELGEERCARRVARCIKQALEEGTLQDTMDLRRAVVRATGPRRIGGVDPATRTFQALRMAVNEELPQLDALLGQARELLRPGGVAVFISFHSLEDRKVKREFQNRSLWEPLTRKPVTASVEELARNPRSRSAKLRAARRLPTEEQA